MHGRRLSGAILAIILAGGCATTRTHVSREILSDGHHYVKLVETRGEGDTALLRYDHPVDFEPEDLFYILGTVRVSKKILRGWSAPEPVFSASARALLAPYLATAFQTATGTEYVAFKVTQRVPGLLLPKNNVTAGTMFVRDNEFHLQLEYVDTPAEDMERITYRPERDNLRGTARLEPGEGMRLVTPPHADRPYRHWIAADWPTLQARLVAGRQARARREAAREERRRQADTPSQEPGWDELEENLVTTEEGQFTAPPPAAEPPEDADTRLRRLQTLRDQGLITEEEFAAKRQAILDSL